jgi:hypothetical protein
MEHEKVCWCPCGCGCPNDSCAPCGLLRPNGLCSDCDDGRHEVSPVLVNEPGLEVVAKKYMEVAEYLLKVKTKKNP